MSSRGIGTRGVFLIVFLTLAAIAIGIDWLIEGHVSKPFLWWLLSIYVGLILAGLHERLDDIRDNTEEIKKQNEDFKKRLERMENSLREDHDFFSKHEGLLDLQVDELAEGFERFERESKLRLEEVEDRLPREITHRHESFPELNGVHQGLCRLNKVEREIRDKAKLDEIRERDLLDAEPQN